MGLDEVIASKGKLKILKVLFRENQVNITRLVRETGLHHKLVSKHVEELKKLGIVGEKRYGRLRIVYIDYRDPRVPALREILKTLDTL